MRKRIIAPTTPGKTEDDFPWLDLETAAVVEVTAEAAGHPVEAALVPGAGGYWQADAPGTQTIRLCFDRPQALRRVRLLFEEAGHPRTQEFVLRWSADGHAYQDIVRQQYNFAPPDATRELEHYDLDLEAVSFLELTVVPDISGGDSRASLAQMRLG